MKLKREQLLLYAITDQSWTGEMSLYKQVEQALEGGITFLQLREKNLSREEIKKEAIEIKKLCQKYQVPFLINDDVELAMEVDADGVHVGQSDMEVFRAREILGEKKVIGVSAKTVEQAILAERSGADYLGVGAVFPTGTKKDAKQVEHTVVKQICESVNIPVVAIGGITRENAMELREKNLSGIAVISAVFAQKDIKKSTEELKKIAGMIAKSS